MTDFWTDKRVLVTGASGFLASYLVPLLEKAGAEVVPIAGDPYDLRYWMHVGDMFSDAGQIDVVFHLAAVVGGIGANRDRPADFYHDNALMNAHIVFFSHFCNVDKLVCVGSVCAYPKHPNYPFREDHLFEGYPEETNAAYGIAKRGLLVHLQAARSQYGLNGIYLIPTNLYGPRDDFDPDTSHVIPALVRKFVEAADTGVENVTVWGTGQASRDFLYAGDCAQALLLAAEYYDGAEPVNLGSGCEVRIAWLVDTLKRVTGFEGEIVWDTTKPDGQPRRILNTDRAQYEFGWEAETSLEAGLKKTIEWWLENRGVTV